jgi:hypothetical protein
MNKLCLNDSGAVGVHEWCEIRLIQPQGRLALCEESGWIWHSWWAFWLLFTQIKSDKKTLDFTLGVATPNPRYFLTRCCLLFLVSLIAAQLS